jgi:zinc transport system ATP-binding protein
MTNINSIDPLAIIFDDISVSINNISILENITAAIPMNSFTAVIGPNGAGKTTLLLALLNQIKYNGSIKLSNNFPIKKLKIGYIPQRFAFDRNFPLSVMEFLAINLQKIPLWLGIKKKYQSIIQTLLSSVKADNLIDKKLGELSGGEIQKILLGLALLQKPDLLILDEPTAGVDLYGEHVFCELLENLRNKYQLTIIMVNHDLTTVAAHASHIICLNKELIATGTTKEILTKEILTKTFGPHAASIINKKHLCDHVV